MTTTPASIDTFDVLIAGGGLVGGSLAVALARTDLRVALVEAFEPDNDLQPSFDDRTIALSHGSCNILRQLGTWELLADSVWPIRQIHISEARQFGTALIDAAEQGIAELGYVIKSRTLGQGLWQQIEQLENLTVLCPARVTGSSVDSGNGVRAIEIEGQSARQTINARLLIVADGARSKLREALGVGATEHDYRQSAIVANVQIAQHYAGHRAYERFTAAGPLALLPGKNGLYTVVMARPSAAIAELMDMRDEHFLQLVQEAFGFRLGRLRRIGQRYCYPLALTKADALIAERAVMIGNAAHGLHPVAGQGFNLGLRDVATLAELLVDAQRTDGAEFDAGSAKLLDLYLAWRGDDQRKVVAFTDGLIRFFALPGKTLAAGRGLGLTMFDVFPAGKRELARQTMGLAGRMTRLARGLDL